jgi:PAS domain S-box-containing protein
VILFTILQGWGIKLSHNKFFLKRFWDEWQLGIDNLDDVSAFSRFFRNYVGPIRFVSVSFVLIMAAIAYHYYELYTVLNSDVPLSSSSRNDAFVEFGWNAFALIGLLFLLALSNLFIITQLIFKSADLIGVKLEFACVGPKNSLKVGCVFSRLNFMIKSIEENRKMIEAYQNDLLEKNTILDESEKKFRHVINTSPDAILVMNEEWKFIQSNHTAHEMFGYNDEELQILTPYNLASNSMSNCLIEEVMQQEMDEFECTCIRKDNTEFPVQIRLKKLDSDKDDTHTLAIITDITERKKNTQRLKESLDEKELLLREIHHRVKNNMQIISSMLGIQAISSTNPEIKEILAGSQSRIMAMMLIHEKLYNTVDIASIDFKKYTYELIQRLYDTCTLNHEDITHTIDVDKLILDIDTALYCGLIINELVSNAFKYAFLRRDSGNVHVSVISRNNHVILSVSDNGTGMNNDIDITKTKSLGLRLVYKLSKFQLKGEFSFESSPSGTHFTITFAPRVLTQTTPDGYTI